MNKLVLATRNKDKVREIKALLQDLAIETIAIDDLLPGFEVLEDKPTILENAAKKALETAQATGLPCLADDTGLFIDALQGEPGVLAARFAGPGCSYADNRRKALSMLEGVATRRAEFRTVAVLALPDGVAGYREGVMTGLITTQERGSNGFGYDAVFEVEGSGLTYAEMDEEQKNACSHRGKAITAIMPLLKEYFTDIIS